MLGNAIDNEMATVENGSANQNINPKFESLDNPKTLINGVKGIKNEVDLEKETNTNSFPLKVFPKPIQQIIKETNEALNFPVDFMGASILYAISISTGNTHKIEIMRGWQENAVLYLSLVGKAGTNKSHPLSFAIKPVEKQDKKNFLHFEKEKEEFDFVSSLTKSEKEKEGFETTQKPVWKQTLISDFTPEALAEVHKNNLRGIGVYSDELASWYKNFNRYNNGSEEQLWLSNWSRKPWRINRASNEPKFIDKPFISVIGTIQPKVLNELAKNRTENGFLDRLLFAAPDNLVKNYWSEVELNPHIEKQWETIISRIINLPMSEDELKEIEPKILKLSPEAKRCLFDWQRRQTDKSNKAENNGKKGVYSKMEMYAARFALILEIGYFSCKESDKHDIGLRAVEGAIKLVEYFSKMAFKVHSIISSTNPFDDLPSDKQSLYNSLPNSFTTKEGVKIAVEMKIAERTFKDFLTKKNLFEKPKRGHYEKIL